MMKTTSNEPFMALDRDSLLGDDRVGTSASFLRVGIVSIRVLASFH
jgi:hypothetical protein